MPDPQFRPQYRPIDPAEAVRLAAEQPRLLALEVSVSDDEASQGARWGCRLVDLISGEELARHAAGAVPGAGELQALAWGVTAAAEADPHAQLVVRGSADLVQRLRVEQLG